MLIKFYGNVKLASECTTVHKSMQNCHFVPELSLSRKTLSLIVSNMWLTLQACLSGKPSTPGILQKASLTVHAPQSVSTVILTFS